MSILKRKRDLLKLARTVCPDATIATTNGSHIAVTIKGPNGTRKIVCSHTSSDHRDIKNIKRNMINAAKEVGLIANQNEQG